MTAAPHPAEPAAQGAFSADYATARAAFHRAAEAAGARLEPYLHPLSGPAGEALATDTAWIGPSQAARVLVLQSATHGVEGFCGSAVQVDVLRAGPADWLPEDTALLCIHALNPHGFAWLRRVNEDGVDLNRNFIDFSQPLPANHGYDLLADALVPPPEAGLEAVTVGDAALADHAARHGQQALEAAVTAGQHTHRDGLFYGGTGPTWSRLTLESLMLRHRISERAAVAVVDIHTGLGPFGYGELICDHPPASQQVATARAWWGESVTEPALGTSSSGAKTGLVDFAWHAQGPHVVFVTLEYGTYPTHRMFEVLRADHMLHRGGGGGDWQAPRTRAVKAALRRHFYPDTDDWREQVLWRSRQVVRQALAGLAAAG